MRERNYEVLPEHMRNGMKLYLEQGVQPAPFLYHILINDFVHAFGYADTFNQHALDKYCIFLYNEVPVGAWGSRENVDAWIEHEGFLGLLKTATTERGLMEAGKKTLTEDNRDGTKDQDDSKISSNTGASSGS